MRILKISMLLASTMMVQPTLAQSTGAAAPSESGVGIGDIVVTAQRRTESLQKVPLSVTVATAEVLADRHFTDPAQLQFIAPNVQFTSFTLSPGATNFSIRGIGTSSFSHMIEPSVATVIDGVVLARPEMGVMQFADLERIEILAGPQGMLFGKNASAGLINIVTVRPKLGVTEVLLHGETGVVNAVSKCCSTVVQATANVPVGTDAALRLNGYFTDYPNLVRDVVPNPHSDYGHQEYGVKAKLLWEPTEKFSIYAMGDYEHGVGIGTGATTARSTAAGSPLLGLEQAVGIVAGPGNLFRASDAYNDIVFNLWGAQVEANYEFEDGNKITSITAFRSYKARHQFDLDAHQASIFNSLAARFNFHQFTEELRLTSPSDTPLNYQFGAFLYVGRTNRFDKASFNLGTGDVPPGLTDFLGINAVDKLKSTSAAVFGQISYSVTDRFRLTAGARYTHDKLTNDAHADHSDYILPLAPDADYVQTTNANNISWRVSAQYDLIPTLTAYATVSSGYKGPGFNLVNSGGTPLGPEHSNAYEIGLKGRPARNVRLNLSLYWEKVRDLQVQAFRPDIAEYVVSNAGSLRSRGVELDGQWNATPDLSFSGNLSYNDARFTSFTRAQCYPGQTAAQGCLPDPLSPDNMITDATGKRLPNAPEWSGTVAVDYRPALSATLRANLHADLYARSAVNFSANGNPATAQKGYQLVNGNVGVESEDGRWKVSLFCRNCFDKRFVTFIEANIAGIPGDYNQTFGLTSFRTIGLSFDTRF